MLGFGLYYYGARWNDRTAGAKHHPTLGRFVQPDTIVPNPGDAQSFDRYAYVNNNPLKYIDPTGHFGRPPCCITGPVLLPQISKFAVNLTVSVAGLVNSAWSSLPTDTQDMLISCLVSYCLPPIKLSDVSTARENFVTNYVDPTLPDWVKSARDVANALLEIPGVSDALLATVNVPSVGHAPQIWDVVPYKTQLSAGSNLQKHHGILNVWAEANIPGYTKAGAPTLILSASEHDATCTIFNQWRLSKTGSTAGAIDWSKVSAQEIQELSERMFTAAGVPRDVRAEYYREFYQYIYGKLP